MNDPRKIIIRPHITEKITISREQSKYAFEVHRSATKLGIKKAVEELFKVTVLDVNIINVKGKTRRIGRIQGRKKNWKKAIVTLKPGDTIPLFEGM
ncbi:50S ribosomal protein L23 [candidate division WOR-3 bacterium]|nr:50S ribosomal protein L23 [candidate division WOR-3 bacterium]